MRKIILILLFLLPLVSSLEINQPINQGTYNSQPISLFVSSDNSLSCCNYSLDGGSNISFEYPAGNITGLNFGTEYKLTTYCDNEESSEITFYYSTGLSEEFKVSNILFIILGCFLLFMVLGFVTEQPFFMFLGGICLLLTGIYAISTDFNLPTYLQTGVSVVLIGLSMILVVGSSLEWLEL